MAATASGKTEWEGRVGMTYGNFLKRICTLGWALIGVCAAVMYPELVSGGHSERAFGYAAADLLPVGLRGVMLASVMAAAMSTCDALMVAASALFTENIYRNHLRTGLEDGHYLRVGRVAGVVIVAVSWLFSLQFSTVLEGIFTFFQITAAIGISFWMGILWRRMNVHGVFVSFFAAAIALYLAKTFLFTAADYGKAPAIAYQTAVFLPVGVLAGFLASILTPAPSLTVVDRFFTKIHTPIGDEDKLELPLDEAIPKSGRLVDAGGVFIVKPSMESWLGFAFAWGFVLILVFGTQLLLRL